MRLRSVAWAGAAAMVVGGALAWIGADAANAHDMAGHPDDVDSGAPTCAALADLDPEYVELGMEELEARVREASPLPPSMAESHLSGIDGALAAYRPARRDCMRKVVLIHTLASLEHLVGPGGQLWYYAHPSDGLKDHFLSGALVTDLSPQQRQDVVAFVETRVIPALKSDGDADREHWRRMYYGGLLACHAEQALLDQLGGVASEDGCLDVRVIGEASQNQRQATGVIDPWTNTGGSGPLQRRR